ncbi:hypothetical protein [Streptomyces sp. HD]|uniref:hypothetical protein n=1 Tax=Streptomyces sp. HD TaxID=3020892 RepID=UPI00232C77EF|nr:hypothetical protein [Streptomyces sp. HD]MDC0773910.1 hypothetical protein [Streptomyces sp. HD]
MLNNPTLRRTAMGAVATAAACAVWAPTPASASVSDPVLHASTESDYTAACSYSANIQWNRSTSRLTGNATVQNHLWFAACRKKLVVTFVDDEGHTAATTDIVLETACATTDPTCPSRIDKPVNQIASVSRYTKPYIDHIDAAVVDRPR